jgi:hypothetical protein
MLSYGAVGFLIIITIRFMTLYYHIQMHAEEYYGEDSMWKHFPTVIYSVIPIVSTAIFDPVARYLNAFEGHSDEVTRFLNEDEYCSVNLSVGLLWWWCLGTSRKRVDNKIFWTAIRESLLRTPISDVLETGL